MQDKSVGDGWWICAEEIVNYALCPKKLELIVCPAIFVEGKAGMKWLLEDEEIRKIS